jgi:hypothetical protein
MTSIRFRYLSAVRQELNLTFVKYLIMKKIKCFALFMYVFLSFFSSAQTPEWIVYGSMPIAATRSTTVDDSMHVWVATFGSGVSKLDNAETGNYINFNTSNSSLPDNNTTCVSLDTAGNKWVGTYNSGAVMYDGTNWIVYNNTNGLPGNRINCITVDSSNNTKWFGINYNGVTSYDGATFQTWKTTNSLLPNNNVNCITVDESGNKWIGTYAGLAKFDGTNWTVFTVGSTAADNQVYSIVFENSTTIWIGSGGGLWKFDGVSTWVNYNTSNSELPYDYVSCIDIDLDGNIWVGTTQGGLAMFDGTSAWTIFNTTNSLIPDMDIRSITVDKNDNKWIATNYGGLAFYGIPTTVGINELTENQNASVYPNPFNNTASIEIKTHTIAPLVLTLFDLLGNEVKRQNIIIQKSGTTKAVIDRGNLNGGIYFYQICTSDGVIQSGKLVIE